MGKHQRVVSENKNPENISSKPKDEMICNFIKFHYRITSANYANNSIYTILVPFHRGRVAPYGK
jgi:hypothetical protein